MDGPDGEVTWSGPVWAGSYIFKERPDSALEEGGSPSPQVIADDPSPGAGLFAARCGSCHNLAAERNIGPHLEGLIGRRAVDIAGFNASAVLTALDLLWTEENLAEYIANPDQFAPGTTMADIGITDEEAQQVVEFLAANK